jgi:hypothetical protein
VGIAGGVSHRGTARLIVAGDRIVARSRSMRHVLLALALVSGPGARAAAQTPGSVAADRARIAEITGNAVAPREDPALLEWFPLLRYLPYASRIPLRVVEPELRVVHNSHLPFTFNDGPLWAGRGLSLSVGGGFSARYSLRGVDIRAAVAPTLVFSQNEPFEIAAPPIDGRSNFANALHPFGQSLDYPMRFGATYLLRVDPGRSSVTVQWDRVRVGVTAENEVWGPGIRNQLIMSAHAPGIPRVFASTARPLRSRFGALEAKWIAGTLTESMYFDNVPTNDYRALSGFLLHLRPRFDSNLVIGVARTMYKPIANPWHSLGRAHDVLVRWEPLVPSNEVYPNRVIRQHADQIMSLFARWVVPSAGLEVYSEWARMDLPRTLEEALVNAHHSAGYTMGAQWALPRERERFLRLQAEASYLEQNRVYLNRPLIDFYAGNVSVHGYTNRGQVIGAAIGPGGSSQWFAIDHLWRWWQLGAFVGRIRWENDAMYRQPASNFFRHDVTGYVGARGGVRTRVADVQVETSYGKRYNYLFQYGGANPGGFRTVDINNLTFAITATPR